MFNHSRLTYSYVFATLLLAHAGLATTYNCSMVRVGSNAATASGINNAGTIVGTYFANGIAHGFVQNTAAGNLATVDYVGASTTQLSTINNSGIVVGQATVNNSRVFFRYDTSSGAFSPITAPAPYTLAAAYGINDNGAISAIFAPSAQSPVTFAIINPDGTATLVPGFGGAGGSGQSQNAPASINLTPSMLETDNTFGETSLASANGTLTSIAPPSPQVPVYAFGLNNAGTVVGYYLTPQIHEGPFIPFVLDASGTRSDAVCPGITLFGPTPSTDPYFLAINDNGVLAGTWIATPLPGSAQISLSTTNLTFPPTPVGQTTPPQTITVTNTGSARLDMVGDPNLFATNTSVFALFRATGCLDSSTSTGSLDPGASCTISVTARPSQQGTQTAPMILHNSAPGSPSTLTLSITGIISPPTCTVSSTSPTSVSLTAQDATYGLSSIVVRDATNANINVPSFVGRTMSPVVSTASQVNPAQDSRVDLSVTNTMGASTSCGTTFGGTAISQWTDLGGSITGRISVAGNADGRLQAFARGTDNALWTVAQAAPDGAWGTWQRLGGFITSNPGVGVNADGRLEAFALGGDSSLWHIAQTSPGGSFGAWSGLGNTLASDPAVTTNSDGRLQVFVAGSDAALWTISQTSPGGGWSDWGSLGGVVMHNPAAITNANGIVEAFVLGSDASIWHIWQTSVGGSFGTWAGLGGSFNGDPVVVRGPNGISQIVATGTDNALHTNPHIFGQDWSGWSNLGGYLTSSPAAAFNSDGRLEVFVRGGDDGLWHIAQTSPAGAWGSWSSLGGAMQDKLAAAVNADGIMDAFSETNSATLQFIGQTSPGVWQDVRQARR
jgi:hypothetical protein